MRSCSARTVKAAALAAAALLAAAPAPATAIDCTLGGCIDAARLPMRSGVDMAEIIARAQRFFRADAPVYVVSSDVVRTPLPYMLPRQEPLVTRHQIHIPEIYHAQVELLRRGAPRFVWRYIIGHEMAHVYQEELKLLEAMVAPVGNKVVLAELHADYLAGFFMAAEFGLPAQAIEELLREMRTLPSGRPGTPGYHGAPAQRFFMVGQGALSAYRRPRPTLAEASVAGIDCVFGMVLGSGAAACGGRR